MRIITYVHCLLTPVEAGAGAGAIVLGVPSMEAPPPPLALLLVLAPPLEAFTPARGGTVAAAGATAGAVEAAGEAAALTGAVVLLLLGAAVGLVAFGGWALKAVARDRVPGTPWELS